jgi:hypothetical protein
VTSSSSGALVTVTTTAPSFTGKAAGSAAWFYALWLPLFGFVTASFRLVRKSKNRTGVYLTCTVLLCGITFQSACGGSNQIKPVGGTPPGNYTITVTGTSGSLQQTTNFALTVQ